MENLVSVKNIGKEYKADLLTLIGGLFNTYGTPKIGLFNGENIIGGVLLDEDYLPWEFRFDVIISEEYRRKGYLKLLINKLREDFNNDSDAEQLAAIVINRSLTNILVNRFGFNVGEFEGNDFVWINK